MTACLQIALHLLNIHIFSITESWEKRKHYKKQVCCPLNDNRSWNSDVLRMLVKVELLQFGSEQIKWLLMKGVLTTL